MIITKAVKLGISGRTLQKADTSADNYPLGFYVGSVDQNSDAYVEGLRKGDIITSMNGVSMENDDISYVFGVFYKEIWSSNAGQTANIVAYRIGTGSTMNFTIKLEAE